MARPSRSSREMPTAPPVDPAASNVRGSVFDIRPDDTAAVEFAKHAFNNRPGEFQTVGLDLVVFHRELGAFLVGQGFTVEPDEN